MQVYLLLRNNQQKGPFTLEQLLAQQLKPFDLVWVEGRSAAWQYPGEVASLKPYVPAPPQSDQPYMPLPTAVLDGMEAQTPVQTIAQPVPQTTQPQAPQPQATAPKNVFVSMPRTAAAVASSTAYAAPVPEPVAAPAPVSAQPYMPPPSHQAYTPQHLASQLATPTPVPPVPETKYTRSLDEAEEAYTSWIYNQKTKKKKSLNPKDIGIAAVLLLFIGGGIWLLSQPSVTASHLPAAQPAVTATAVSTTTTTEETISPPTETVINTSSQTAAGPAATENKIPVKEKAKKTTPSLPPVVTENTATPAAAPAEKPRTRETASEPVAVNTAPAPEETSSPKKKKLRDVFKNMFSKKDKAAQPDNTTAAANTPPARPKTAPTQEEPRSATNRQAARRGDNNEETAAPSAAPESATPISDLVDVSSNAPDSWMMGVTGLKVTVRNRSGAVLQSASVEVLYYDQNNKLLDKKTLYFNGVQPKGRQTQAAPDHKWADHIDLKLGTVTAKDDRYAGTK